MSNWNDIWNNISNTGEINQDNINGFNHCENIIESINKNDYVFGYKII